MTKRRWQRDSEANETSDWIFKPVFILLITQFIERIDALSKEQNTFKSLTICGLIFRALINNEVFNKT